ncbi:MAG: hypothetical protein R3C42_08790 [Parvularculaceae bacterium]
MSKKPVAGVPLVLSWNQGGLFRYSSASILRQTGMLYLSYAHEAGANATRIARAQFDSRASQSDADI